MNTEEETSREGGDAGSTQESKPEELLNRAFAAALNAELDHIGYPGPPARTNQLSHDLGLGRMQAFRIGRGDNIPTLKSLLKLQALGVSLDLVLGRLQETQAPEVPVNLMGVPMRAIAFTSPAPSAFVLAPEGAGFTIRTTDPGYRLRPEEAFVGGLRFTRPQPLVAVVEDDADTLEVFRRELSAAFNVVTFRTEKELKSDPEQLRAFDAIVLDWVLPNTDPRQLVDYIRSLNSAPVVVTTGHREQSHAISAVLALPDIQYLAKPVDGDILRALVSSAIAKASLGVR
jgi:CheY-like chemotaxis protein